ncbi:hypothetical protein BGZ58_008256 [Dissophora ornata]|nr:hypothetical protein BGZ58_008256 [Dissophora ornata]
MAELHFFKADLTLELGTKATRKWEANNYTTDETVSKAMHDRGKQSLSHAFLILLQASRSALRKATADFEGESTSDNRLEFSMVKTLVKTICHDKFSDSSLEAIYRGMAIQFSCKPFHVEELDFVDTRPWLLALYDWIRNWSGQSTSLEKNGHDIAWMYRIVSDFLYEITISSSSAFPE